MQYPPTDRSCRIPQERNYSHNVETIIYVETTPIPNTPNISSRFVSRNENPTPIETYSHGLSPFSLSLK